MATSIFELFGSVMVDTAKAEESLQKTDKKAGNLGTTLGNGVKSAAKFAAGLTAAAGAAATGMIKLASDTSANMDVIDKASQRMKIGAESYQELAHAAGLSGVSMEAMEKAAKKLEGTDINMDQAMEQIYALETAEERSALAAELFGEKVAYELTPMLNASGEEFAAMKQEAHDLGLVMDQDSVTAGAKLNDALSNVKDSLAGLTTHLGAALMPVITDACNLIIGFIPTLQDIIERIGPTMGNLLEAILPVLLQLAESLLPPILQLVEALLPVFTLLCETVLPVLIGLITKVVGFIGEHVIPIVTKVVEAIVSGVEKVIDFFKNFRDNVKTIFEEIKEFVKKPVNAIIGFINGLVSGICDGVNGIVRAMNKLSFDIPDWVPAMGGKTFGFNLSEVTAPQIPLLAEGAVIEPNKPFAAILGDQTNGTNVEAPLSTIKQAVSEVLAELGIDVHIHLDPDDTELFNRVQTQARTYTKKTGEFAFE